MSNLIIMTMALGLGAIMALTGVYYGSEAIQNLRAKAEAAQIVAQAQLLAEAWTEYARAHNGNPALVDATADKDADGVADKDYAWGDGSFDLDGKYINTQPVPPARAVPSTAAYYYPIAIKNYDTKACTVNTAFFQTKYIPADTIALQITSQYVCQRITQLAGNTSIPAKATAMTGDLTTANPKRPFDCIYYDSDGTAGVSRGDTFLFLYRVFDQNVTPATHINAC